MLDATRLRVLAAVAAHGSVTEAAQQLGYSQPSVSHHLARLEAEVGVRLTQRVGRGIRLTPEGQLLARRATEIVARIEAASEELASVAGLHQGRVRLAGFQSVLATVVADAATALRRRHPGIDVSLNNVHPDVALRQLADGIVDAAIVFRYDDGQPAGVRSEMLFDDPMFLLSRTPDQTLTDHRDSPWIAGCPSCRRELLDACDTAGFVPHIAYRSDDVIVDQALVAAGLGVTTMPGLALATYRHRGVEASEIVGLRRRIHLATFGEPPDPPATRAFIGQLRAVVARRHENAG